MTSSTTTWTTRPAKQLLQVGSTRTAMGAETFSDAAGTSLHDEEQEDKGEAFSSWGKRTSVVQNGTKT